MYPLSLFLEVGWALAWGMGGSAPPAAQKKFHSWLMAEVPRCNLGGKAVSFFDVLIDWSRETAPSYVLPWEELVPAAPSVAKTAFHQLLVPTAGTAAGFWLHVNGPMEGI